MGVQRRKASESTKAERRRTKEAQELAELVFAEMAHTEDLDDTTIAEHPDVFPVWDENWTGKAGSIVQDEGQLYRSIHDVGAGQNTKPSDTPSMWTRIGNPLDEWPEWVQPLGAHDAYAMWAKVSHSGKHWISDYANNVWEPGVFGWHEAAE